MSKPCKLRVMSPSQASKRFSGTIDNLDIAYEASLQGEKGREVT